MSDPKALWKRAFVTDPRHVKPITGKQYKGNSPKPYWIVERLTDEFGPCGIGWGFSIINERMERLSQHDILHIAVVRMWYVLEGERGELEQIGQTKAAYMTSGDTPRLVVDEDAPKKSVTDALVKCASYLGFAGDIFSGMWDDSKYVQHAAQVWKTKDTPKDAGGVISAPKIAFESLTADWQSWIADLGAEVDNTFEQLGKDAAQSKIDEAAKANDLDDTHMTALFYKLSSKTRSALTAHIKKAA